MSGASESVPSRETALPRRVSCRRVALAGSALALGLGVLTILGWSSGWHVLASVRSQYIPMAPSTALGFMFLGAALLAHNRWPDRRSVSIFSLLGALLASGLAITKLIEFSSGISFGIEELLVRNPEMFGAVLTGRMSPITAASFLLAGTATSSLLFRRTRPLAGPLASVVTAVSGLVVLGYLYGTPLLYGGGIIPVALSTALAFLGFGVALMASAGQERWPLCRLGGASTEALLLRTMLPVTVIGVLLNGALWRMAQARFPMNPALLSALSALLFALALSAVIVQVAAIIGQRIDRAEAERNRAQADLQTLNQQLEQRVADRTAALHATNCELQAEVLQRQRAQRRLHTQYELTRVLAESATLEEATPRILQAIGETLGWDMGALWRVNPRANVLQCVEVWHLPGLSILEFAAVTRQTTFAPGVGLPGRVWKSGEPAWVQDVVPDKNFPRAPLALKENLHGALAFPIQLDTELLGVIEFFSREIRQPDTELLQMFAAVGGKIGQFMERVRARQQLAHYAETLRARNEQMEEELKMARELQLAMLPQDFPVIPRSALPGEKALQFFKFYYPTGAVSGDFFNVFALSDTSVGIFICDVMGHGVRAALVTAMLRALVGQLSPRAADPGQLLTETNRGLANILKTTGTVMYATAFYMVADIARGRMLYANAGHPYPLHLHSTDGTAEKAGARNELGPALGLFEDATYPTAERPLASGDFLLLFTDGLFEVDGPDGQQYSQERLLSAVRKRVQLARPELLAQLLEEIQQFSSNKSFADDVCLVGVEVTQLREETSNA